MPITTRCKFVCREITKSKHWDKSKDAFLFVAKFNPVIDGSEENKKFYSYTPSGSLEIGQYSEDIFEVGKEYFIDVTLVVQETANV